MYGYVGYIDINSKPEKPYQESEVSDMIWLSYEDIKKKIRPYNIEKLEILKKVIMAKS